MADDDILVHVIDDDEAARASLGFLFAASGIAARLWDSPFAFLDGAGDLGRGCLVTDVRMPGMSGLDLIRRLRADGVAIPVVVITGHGDVPLAVEAMKAGALDFIEKPFSHEALLGSVRAALSSAGAAADAARDDKLAGLSARERQVLEGLVAGRANKEIARDLDISPRTVEIYRAKIMAKTGAESFAELVRLAVRADL